jgi:hypothetical protein
MSLNPFAAARQYLWDGSTPRETAGKRRYLCHALEDVRIAGMISGFTHQVAQEMIRSRLGEYRSLESWLCNEAGVSVNDTTAVNMQAYRLRWLDELEQHWTRGTL